MDRFNVYTKTSKATNLRLEANFLPTREYDVVARGITEEMKADWKGRKYIIRPVGLAPNHKRCFLHCAHSGPHVFAKSICAYVLGDCEAGAL
jgi:hypothetical protein